MVHDILKPGAFRREQSRYFQNDVRNTQRSPQRLCREVGIFQATSQDLCVLHIHQIQAEANTATFTARSTSACNQHHAEKHI